MYFTPKRLLAPLAVAGTVIGTLIAGAPNAGADPWKPCGGVAPDSFFSSTAQATQTCKNSGGANWELYSGSPSPSVTTCEEGDAGCGGNTEKVGKPDTGPLHLLPDIHMPCFACWISSSAELSPPKPGLGLGLGNGGGGGLGGGGGGGGGGGLGGGKHKAGGL